MFSDSAFYFSLGVNAFRKRSSSEGAPCPRLAHVTMKVKKAQHSHLGRTFAGLPPSRLLALPASSCGHRWLCARHLPWKPLRQSLLPRCLWSPHPSSRLCGTCYSNILGTSDQAQTLRWLPPAADEPWHVWILSALQAAPLSASAARCPLPEGTVLNLCSGDCEPPLPACTSTPPPVPHHGVPTHTPSAWEARTAMRPHPSEPGEDIR